MKLLDLLKAAAGEDSLSSALGRWRQAVSIALGGLEPAYVMASRVSTTQDIGDLGAATDIVFNWQVSAYGSAISFDPLTGKFTLQPGIYELDARLQFEDFNAGTDIATFVWRGDDGGPALDVGAAGVAVSVTGTQDLAPQPSIKAYIRTSTVRVVKVVSAGGQGIAKISADSGSFATVRKIG